MRQNLNTKGKPGCAYKERSAFVQKGSEADAGNENKLQQIFVPDYKLLKPVSVEMILKRKKYAPEQRIEPKVTIVQILDF